MDGGLRAFQNRMDGGGSNQLLVWSLVCFAFSPLIVLVHELGHAVVPLVRSESHLPREAALDALHAATRGGAFGPGLTIAAARTLSALPQHPGRHVDIGRRPALVPGRDEAAMRAAFVYGIAVRDIERVRE